MKLFRKLGTSWLAINCAGCFVVRDAVTDTVKVGAYATKQTAHVAIKAGEGVARETAHVAARAGEGTARETARVSATVAHEASGSAGSAATSAPAVVPAPSQR